MKDLYNPGKNHKEIGTLIHYQQEPKLVSSFWRAIHLSVSNVLKMHEQEELWLGQREEARKLPLSLPPQRKQ